MKQIWNGIQVAFTALGGFLGWFLGGVDGFLYALIAFVVIDYITGVLCAISDKNLSSAVGFKGICRKVLIFTLVGMLENAAHLGLPIPEKLKAVLEQLHDRATDEKGGEE